MAATQEALYGAARPGALLVGAAAPRARADEARPPPPPVPREVRPAARRGAPRAVRRARRARARPVRRLRDDARPVPRVGARRRRRRRRGLQLPADAREDAPPQPRRDPPRPPLGARAGRRLRAGRPLAAAASPFVRAWYAPRAAAELLHFRSLAEQVASVDVLRVVLARAARSARRTTHFDLDFPRAPQLEPYWCHKHRRTCRPVEEARRFLLRYTLDTLDRIETFAARRDADARTPRSCHGDARELELGGPFDARDHVAAVPRADRLPRAAPLRVRAPRARRAPRPRLGRPRAASAARRSRRTSTGVADVLANAAGPRPVRPSASSSTIGVACTRRSWTVQGFASMSGSSAT